MKITVYRPNQIGGCITEIESKNGTRIIVDVGSELPGIKSGESVDINKLTKGCAGVFLTHYHGDHAGEYKNVHEETPIYMGAIAQKIYYTLQTRLSKSEKITGVKPEDVNRMKNARTFKQDDIITVGDLNIKPIRTDHSAFDSYMFLVDDGDKCILHTGDFRNHGMVGEAAFKYLIKNTQKVDALIVEGTMLSRISEAVDTEDELSQKAKQLFEDELNKYVFILCSSTNIDRIAAFYRAYNEASKNIGKKRLFVTDDYQNDVLKVVTENSSEFGNNYDFSESVSFNGDKHYDDMVENGFCMLVRKNRFSEKFLNTWKFKKNRLFIYSLWKGYLEGNTQDKEIADMVPSDYKYMHTSGHATEDAICMLCEIVGNPPVFPIHSENTDRFEVLKKEKKINSEVRQLESGKSVEV
jgi:ribonuclease J